MIAWLIGRWHARLRRIDVEILWPEIKSQATDIYHARAAFALHAFNDSAWQNLGRTEIYRQVDSLK